MLTDDALLRLASWLSPAFPVGAYTYSHGLEWAVEQGMITDTQTLTEWCRGLIEFGSGRLDAELLRIAHAARLRDDLAALAEIEDRAWAMRGTQELALESTAQGRAFLAAVRSAWPHPELDLWAMHLDAAGREPAYPVAVGVAAACHGVPLEPLVLLYLHGFAANLISAAVRLVPLGQTQGLETLAALEPVIRQTAAEAAVGYPADMGTATPMLDWASMCHETQYTRLFRS